MRVGRSPLLVAIVGVALVAAACSTGDSSDPPTAAGGTATTSAGTGTVPTPTGSAPPAGTVSEVYGDDANWLCAPELDGDLCTTEDLDTTIVRADGGVEVVEVTPADDPPFDCFYVYPTVNLTVDAPADEAMSVDTTAERAVIRSQAARFSEVCEVYAPLYRQLTLSGFGSPERDELLARAEADVAEAFDHYLATWNEGRPIMLIGHSQGAAMLLALLEDRFDDDPDMRDQLVSAMLIGGRTEVPIDADAGGSLDNIPRCRSAEQTGCVIGFNTVAVDTAPEDVATWGTAEGAGNQRLCTNPADLSGDGPGPLRSIFAAQGTFTTRADENIETPWVEIEDFLEAECVIRDGYSVLEVRVAPSAPDDVRDLGDRVRTVPFWGLHINEVNLTQGNLIDIARTQGAAMSTD